VKHFLSFYLQQIQITIKTWFVFGYGIIGLHTSIPSEENTDKHKDLQKKKILYDVFCFGVEHCWGTVKQH
jgi:hypothetical protein